MVQKIKQITMKLLTHSTKTLFFATSFLCGVVLASTTVMNTVNMKTNSIPKRYLYVLDSADKILDSLLYQNESFYADVYPLDVRLATKIGGDYIPIYRWSAFQKPIIGRSPALATPHKNTPICSVNLWLAKYHLPESTIQLAVNRYHAQKAHEAQILQERWEKRTIDSFYRLSKNGKKDSWDTFSQLVVNAGLVHCSAIQPYQPILKGYYEQRIKDGLLITESNRKYIAPFLFVPMIESKTNSKPGDYPTIYKRTSKSSSIRSVGGEVPAIAHMGADHETLTDDVPTPDLGMPLKDKVITKSPSDPEIKRLTKTERTLESRPVAGMSTVAPGQITAGVWNDVDHWNEFQKTHGEVSVQNIANRWGMRFNRQLVKFTDKHGKPLVDAKVTLLNSDNAIVWSSKTDNRGLCVLYLDFKGPLEPNGSVYRGISSSASAMADDSAAKLSDMPVLSSSSLKTEKEEPKSKVSQLTGKLRVTYGEHVFEKKNWKLSPNFAAEEIQINTFENSLNRVVDICLVVDATGSMGDELHYLKSEMMDVMMRAQGASPCAKFRFSSVFYRDLGDLYVTKSTPFTDRVDDVIDFVNQQSVGGGGDFPEAVDSALAHAVNGLEWSDRAISRIIFLVLDAPAHDYAALQLRNAIEKAAKLGIKIIPIAASGIDKNSEFLFKYMSTATYGDYVYITDHSGIGNSHLKPTGVKENKQYLNDLMVELISKYSTYEGCDPQTTSPMEPRVELFGDQEIQIQAYPNPAIHDLSIQCNQEIESAEITALDGRVIKLFEHIGQKSTYVSVNGITAGIYVLRCKIKNSSLVYTTKILVMPSANNQGMQSAN